MQLDFERMFRRYVYDPQKTPYGVPVDKLNRGQADSEIFVFSLFIGILFAVTGVAGLSGKLPHGNDPVPSIYAFFTVFSAVMFAWQRAAFAATFTAIAPIAILAYLAIYGFPARLGTIDKVLLVGVVGLIALYAWRILRIAKIYPELPPAPPKRRGRRNPYE